MDQGSYNDPRLQHILINTNRTTGNPDTALHNPTGPDQT